MVEIADTAIHERQDEVFFLMQEGGVGRRSTEGVTLWAGSEFYMVDEARPEDAAIAADDVDGDDGEDAAVERRDSTVGAALHGERLDKAIVGFVPEFSRNHLQQLIKGGWVKVDGAAVTSPAQRVRAGQRVDVTLQPTEESRAYRAEALPIAVVHEDDDVLVIDKAAGMVVHPAAGNWSGTLLNALLARDPASAALPRAGIVHRLDKDTSGLMVVGRTLAAVTALTRAIAAREVQRRYLAIAHGAPAHERVDASRRRSGAIRRCGRGWRSSRRARRRGPTSSASPRARRLRRAPLHAAQRPDAPDPRPPRGARPAAGRRPSLRRRAGARHGSARRSTPRCWRSRHPRSGERLAFESAPPGDFAHAWGEVVAAGPS